MIKIKISSISVSHGEKIVGNEPYIEHFKKKGKDVEHFLKEVIGRDKRYMFENNNENSLSLATRAAEDVLKKSGLTGADMDMIVFSSQLPEYTAPPSSICLHHAVSGKRSCICYDINSNCTGMTICYEQVMKYMSVSPNVTRALIVGCDYINLTLNPEDERFYGHYGDAACAVILEKSDCDAGMIDSIITVDSTEYDTAVFPPCGFSNLFRSDDKNQRYLKSTPNTIDVPSESKYAIGTLLERNNLNANDISMFCLSQYALVNIQAIRSEFGIEEARSLYIGNEYGYTGTTSPFITLYEADKRGLIKRGDYYVMWTIGGGIEHIGVLCKY